MTEKEALILGALLHDIGKFMQRAGVPPVGYDNFTKEDYGKHGAHAKWSASFVTQYLPQALKSCGNYVLYHHKPQNKEHKIIQIADWLSSGERFEEAEEMGKSSIETPLMSIFSEIGLNGENPIKNELYFPLKQISFKNDDFFPKEKFTLSRSDYSKLWEAFVSEIDEVKRINDKLINFNTMLSLLKKYLSRIPAATPTEFGGSQHPYLPDISLFDHSRTTAAITACLLDLNMEEEEIDIVSNAISKIFATTRNKQGPSIDREDVSHPINKERFLFVSGDVTGIQKFIYSITSEGASKGLRGRSFYLRLLGETVAKYLLDKLQLPIANLIFSTGGHFFLLAPMNKKRDLLTLQTEINKKMLKIHGGDLGLVMGWTEISCRDFLVEWDKSKLISNFSQVWKKVSQEVNKSKRQKLKDVIESDYSNIFEPSDKGGKADRCKICKRELRNREKEKCSFCLSFEGLGDKIRSAEVMVEGKVPESNVNEVMDWKEAMSLFGRTYDFIKLKEMQRLDHFEELSLTLLNGTNMGEKFANLPKGVAQNISLDFAFAGQVVPLKKDERGNEIMTFEDMAKASEGIHRLGVLRMDVDNLGKVFQKGLAQRATISRVSALSFNLSLFFEGWINEFLKREDFKNKNKKKDTLYLIYSGGDDLFLVGSWDKIIEAAYGIRKAFGKYTVKKAYASNPSEFIDNSNCLGLSAGIALIPEKYPIYKGADIAGDFEDESKEFSRKDGNNPPKDAVTFLGNTLGWEKFEMVQRTKGILYKDIKKGKENENLPHSILNRLHLIYNLYEDNKRFLKDRGEKTKEEIEEKIRYDKWRWRLIYSLRNFAKEKAVFKEDMEKIQKAILEEDLIENLNLPVRWAELLLRGET